MKYTALLCVCILSFLGCGEDEPSTPDTSMANMMTGGTMSMLPLGGNMMTPSMGGNMMMMSQGGAMMSQGGNTPQGGNMMPQGGNNMTPAPTPAQNCGELISCVSACAQGDMACQQTCFDIATPNAQNEYNAFSTCAQGAGCAPDDVQCVQMNCGAELDVCTPQGNQYQDCGEMVGCLRRCPQDDMSCQQNCLGGATRAAQNSYSALSTCVQGAGCSNTDLNCAEANCGAELDICTPQGAQSCLGILMCLNTCASSTDSFCVLGCIESGTLDGQDLYMDIEECLQGQCTQGDQACINMAAGPSGVCAPYVSACQTGMPYMP